ncbi:Inosine-5'-monophosphate dehydrogenase [[Actinomadura] parvosata subsp. kistnae]|uniref:CBS domain-containing protein n=1 Tax=[Actinomadura] parvosata TaxID=1955412 RepID=UPI0009AC200D|nr:CBS domain-containing protein [Nonomuraea sp. ATCC 55076]SPL98859.1 Inosine-5'-monophosphate dehydrogenase [Actinomadura parvosata subsp. kistnae]
MPSIVADVMTTDVTAVNQNASFHIVAELLIDKGVSGVPVLDDDNHVVGVVSEADLLAKEEFKEHYYGDDYRPPLRARVRRTAGSGYRKFPRRERRRADDLPGPRHRPGRARRDRRPAHGPPASSASTTSSARSTTTSPTCPCGAEHRWVKA